MAQAALHLPHAVARRPPRRCGLGVKASRGSPLFRLICIRAVRNVRWSLSSLAAYVLTYGHRDQRKLPTARTHVLKKRYLAAAGARSRPAVRLA